MGNGTRYMADEEEPLPVLHVSVLLLLCQSTLVHGKGVILKVWAVAVPDGPVNIWPTLHLDSMPGLSPLNHLQPQYQKHPLHIHLICCNS